MRTSIAKNGTEYLTVPLTRDEVQAMQEDVGWVRGCVEVTLGEIMDGLDALNSAVSEKLIGTDMLGEIDFRPVDVVEVGSYASVILQVTGYVDDFDDLY